jgi:hypothetical protein
MSSLYKGPSIDASYQVSVHLAEGFQRRGLKCEKLTDDWQWMPSDGKSSHCLWQGELKIHVYANNIWLLMYMTMLKKVYCYYYCLEFKDEKTNNRKKLNGVCQQYIQEH